MRYDPGNGIGHCRAKGVEAPHTGTTIVACVYKDGVVLGSDGRVSVGNYISNRASNKIAPLADHVFLLRSGSAPDAQIVSDNGECAEENMGGPCGSVLYPAVPHAAMA
jgi:20S proteasome alpha/beta subunit